jgi:hypothetical protein
MNDHSAGDQTSWPETWSELIGTATAFRRSCLLFAAIELGVFGAIGTDEVDTKTVASRLDLDFRSTATLLKSLVAVGLLSWRDDRVALWRRHWEFLLPSRNSALPDMRRYIAENVAWLEAASILRGTRQPSPAYARELLDGRIMDFPALGWFNALHAAAVIDTVEDVLTPPRNVLDLGGGDGVFARQILSRYPDTKVTILELEGGAEGCQTELSDAIASVRLAIRYGDARCFAPEAVYDLVVINELLELYCDADKARIVTHAVQATGPAGKVLVVKFTLDESGVEPAAAAVFSMRMRMKFGSHLETDAEVAALLCRSGCARPLIRRVGPLKSVLLAGRQPSALR